MIIANIADAQRYFALHEKFKEVFDILKTISERNLPKGISGEGYKINLSGEYTKTFDLTEDGMPRLFEAHREYIDIHYCIDGAEGFAYNRVENLEPVSNFDAENDYGLYKGTAYKFTLLPGDFCIVFPEDAHIPALVGNGEAKVLKAVAKIKLQFTKTHYKIGEEDGKTVYKYLFKVEDTDDIEYHPDNGKVSKVRLTAYVNPEW